MDRGGHAALVVEGLGAVGILVDDAVPCVLDIEDLYALEQNPVDISRDGIADNTGRQLLISTFRVPI
jgi:hypothetical protein